MSHWLRAALASCLGLACVGCSTVKQTNTARTAREQLLISNAVDQSFSKVDFSAFRGQTVFVDEKYIDSVDKAYIIGSLRHHLMYNGALIAGKPEEADSIVEVRSGGVGTDNADAFIGTPEIVLPGMLTLPEVRFASRTRQSAVAKIGIVAYDAKTHELLGAGGVTSAQSSDNNTFVLGIGPFQNGTVKQEIDRTIPRQPGQAFHEMPTQVAFQGGLDEEGPNENRYQLTSGRQGEKKKRK